MTVRKIKEGIHAVGALHPDRKLFDELIPLPDGTSYNSYLIQGSEKTLLIDTVDPDKEQDLIDNLNTLNIKNIDYIVAHHGEQDHSGTIPKMLELFPNAKVITNQKCKDILKDFLLISEDKFIVINDGDTILLGDKTCEFIFTPWVHWPETMVTYLREDKILFSCDFFGSHMATEELFVVNEEKVYKDAKRYFAEIMMPFRPIIKKNLERLSTYEIELIAPSHGPVYNKPSFIIDAYKDWISDDVKNEVVLAYVSMHGSTLAMVNYFEKALLEKGVAVKKFNLTQADIGELAAALVDAATVVIASPTVLTGPHPSAVYAAFLVNALRPKTKFASIIGSYSWGSKMVDTLKGLLGNLKVELLEPVVAKGYPKEEDFKLLNKLVEDIVANHKEINIV